LKNFDYERHILIIGDLPFAEFISLWEKEISKNTDLANSLEVKKLEKNKFIDLLQEKEMVKEGEIDTFFDRIADPQKRLLKKTMTIIENTEEWDCPVFISAISEARNKNVVFVLTTNKIAAFSQDEQMGIFANVGNLIIGNLKEEERKYLMSNTYLGEKYAREISNLTNNQVMVILTKNNNQQLIAFNLEFQNGNYILLPQKISIYLRENDMAVGVIIHNDQRLTYTICSNEPELDKFLKTNVPIWEKSTFDFHYGGVNKTGNHWSGIKKVTIADSDFINGLAEHIDFHVKKQVFNMKYYFVS
jgi:hypothetical protein